MKVKFWGCRGSIPVPDSRMIRYGGNTTCVEVTLGKKTLIIDAGTGIRKLGEDLARRKVRKFDLFITHSHWDHIQGFPFFPPIYSPKTAINILGCTSAYKQLKTVLSQQMSYEFFPVSFKELRSKIKFIDTCNAFKESRDSSLKLIQTNHPAFTTGIRIDEGGSSFVFMTDNEINHPAPQTKRSEFVRFCKDATYLIHDAQFTKEEYRKRKGWGHSTFDDVIALASDANVKNVGFFHHDPNRRDEELSAIEARYKRLIRGGGYGISSVFAVKELDEFEI